jgi:hypothetical protein
MPRRPAQVTQAEVKRVIKGAIAAGLKVTGVRFDETGLSVLTGPAGAAAETLDAAEIDNLLTEAEGGTRETALLRRP